jgi:hypothetical protein
MLITGKRKKCYLRGRSDIVYGSRDTIQAEEPAKDCKRIKWRIVLSVIPNTLKGGKKRLEEKVGEGKRKHDDIASIEALARETQAISHLVS